MAEPAPRRSNLVLRLLTAAVWAPFLLWLLYIAPSFAFPVVAGIVCLFCAWELFQMVAPEHLLLRVWGLLSTALLFTLLVLGSSHVALVFIAITFGGMLLALSRPEPLELAAVRMGWSVAGPMYLGGMFGAIAMLFQRDHGGSWVLLAMLCGFISDTAGYFVGRALGKRPLSSISPKKTIEGSLGGLAGGLASGLVAHYWFLPSLPLLPAVWLSLLATAAGQAGDLAESLIKRSTGVKDSGTLLPGHGGFLDRSDAMLFSAVVIYLYTAFAT